MYVICQREYRQIISKWLRFREKKYVNIDFEWSQIEYLRNNCVDNSQVDVYLLKATVCLALVKKLDMSLLDMSICDSLKR